MKKYGVYNAEIESDMTIKGITNKSTEKGTITVEGKKITVDAKTKIALADYKIAFEKGKSSTNIAKEIDVILKENMQL